MISKHSHVRGVKYIVLTRIYKIFCEGGTLGLSQRGGWGAFPEPFLTFGRFLLVGARFRSVTGHRAAAACLPSIPLFHSEYGRCKGTLT